MIAVAIVGVLVAIGYPSYESQVLKANRADAQSFLMDLAQRQQQYLIDARRYAPTLAELTVTTPERVARSYNVSIAAAPGPPPTFTLTAAPIAGSKQARDLGGAALTLTQAGAKAPHDAW
jgi:type IV pilus assembly protein PilE